MMDIFNLLNDNIHLFLLLVALLSLVVGSFLNVVIHRLPIMLERSWSEECRIYLGLKIHHDEGKYNLYFPFSHCPHCKKNIPPWHNVPVISYLLLRGRCAYCRGIISIRYPLVEILTCTVSVYLAWRYGVSWKTLGGLSFSWICISLIFIDIDHHLLPDQLTLLLVWLGLLFSLIPIFCTPQEAILGGVVGYLIFAITQLFFGFFTGKIGMGQGDYKFLAGIGTFLGVSMLPLVILLASISGVIITLTQMTIKRDFRSMPLPFGPYLAVAGWLALMWGKEIMNYYLNIF